MSEPLRNQISDWWQTVSSEETLNTYQNALQVTWNILRETAKLIWLFFCLILVFFDWFRDTAVGLGQQLRSWVNALPEPKAEHAWSEVIAWSKSISQVGTYSLVNQARGQLGIAPVESRPVTQPAMTPASEPVVSRPAMPPKAETASAPVPSATTQEAADSE